MMVDMKATLRARRSSLTRIKGRFLPFVQIDDNEMDQISGDRGEERECAQSLGVVETELPQIRVEMLDGGAL